MKGTDNWWKEFAGKRCYIVFENSTTGEEKRVYGTVLDRPGLNLDEVWVKWDDMHPLLNEQLIWLAYLHFEEDDDDAE